ncbi:hypothetical protein ACQKH5_15400 [Hyphomonas sp. NPDC076900]|uniref:hypothetical protein n=1 Tax=unclassified Hyphomonas TaxID=2630699 RepID=UPI003D08DE28
MLKPLAALAALAAISAQAALACSCIPCEELGIFENEKGIAFVGELVSIRELGGDDSDDATPAQPYPLHVFRVLRSLKGDLPEYVHIQVDTYSTCLTRFPFEGLNAVSAIELGEDSFGSKEYYADGCTQLCWSNEDVRSLVTERTHQTDFPDRIRNMDH